MAGYSSLDRQVLAGIPRGMGVVLAPVRPLDDQVINGLPRAQSGLGYDEDVPWWQNVFEDGLSVLKTIRPIPVGTTLQTAPGQFISRAEPGVPTAQLLPGNLQLSSFLPWLLILGVGLIVVKAVSK